MEIIRGIRAIRRFTRPVVAIGIFDGVHRGHARILKECGRIAARIGGTPVMLSFWPHPRNEGSIYSLEHRLAVMESLGIRVAILIRFSEQFSSMSAARFIRTVVCRRIGAAHILVGENFRFGRRLEGDISTLAGYRRECGFRLTVFPLARYKGNVLSSTRIRRCISSGRLTEASRMLGRPVSLLGKVVGGRRVARGLGYPTANIKPQHEVLPPDGIYAVRAIVGGKSVPGICYKGMRPTFAGRNRRPCVEVHLFGFAGNLYGKQVEVRFFGARIRADRKFASPEQLAGQIKKDVIAAKKILSST